ncbi:MAG: hypothetical protein LBV60_16665, partial [Streptomyces sp.]|nr:hypothetical protein [Streptomyces sp.]
MTQPLQIQVDDQTEGRIRRPVDLLRCLLSCVWIVVLSVVAVAASATTTGAETDIKGASRRLPHALLSIAPRLALFVLLVLSLSRAVSLVAKRQVRRLAEAAATGLLAGLIAEAVNLLLARQFAGRLYYS